MARATRCAGADRGAQHPLLVRSEVERRLARRLPGTWVLGAPSLVFPAAPRIPVSGARSPTPCASSHRKASARWSWIAQTALDDTDAEAERLPPVAPVALVTLVEQVRPDAAQTLAYFAEQDVR